MKEYTCSFCGRPDSECKQIVVTENETAICNKCVARCLEIMMEHVEKADPRKLPENTE